MLTAPKWAQVHDGLVWDLPPKVPAEAEETWLLQDFVGLRMW